LAEIKDISDVSVYETSKSFEFKVMEDNFIRARLIRKSVEDGYTLRIVLPDDSIAIEDVKKFRDLLIELLKDV